MVTAWHLGMSDDAFEGAWFGHAEGRFVGCHGPAWAYLCVGSRWLKESAISHCGWHVAILGVR